MITSYSHIVKKNVTVEPGYYKKKHDVRASYRPILYITKAEANTLNSESSPP